MTKEQKPIRVVLMGTDSAGLKTHIAGHSDLVLVDDDPDVVICFGGDGTLLTAELQYPGVPKVPLRNSRRGIRCMPHPPEEVIRRLAEKSLFANSFVKLEGTLKSKRWSRPLQHWVAMNEFNVHMARINSAVRFQLWVNDIPYQDSLEIVGDGFVVATPFGSTAYYHQITHGVFYSGIGIAFKYSTEHTSHLVVPESSTVRFLITRGPAVLAYDNAPEYYDLEEGDELIVCQHNKPATILTWEPIRHPCDAF
ncbi:MAG TPA: hypothetical protein PLN86_08340 [Candidatus Hydrogenedentes bacterium]|nr:hypothetical protein [Candidatus Hydrogenedentota bacterium]